MLTAIEARLEDTITAATLQPQEAVQATERAYEQDRRRVRWRCQVGIIFMRHAVQSYVKPPNVQCGRLG
jgi:hypothetical protein